MVCVSEMFCDATGVPAVAGADVRLRLNEPLRRPERCSIVSQSMPV